MSQNTLRAIQFLLPDPESGTLQGQDLWHFQGLLRPYATAPDVPSSLTHNQLRSIQGLPPVLVYGTFGEAELRHLQGLFSVGEEASVPDVPSNLTQNQLWSVQQMFPTDGLDVNDLRHFQTLFRVFPEITYEVRGTTMDGGVLVNRRVRVYRRDTGAIIGEADSVNGKVRISTGLFTGEVYIIQIDLDAGAVDFIPYVANRVTPVEYDPAAVW